MYSVNDIYTHCASSGKRMLSNFSADFWRDYVEHYNDYDSLFRRKYLSFRYFLQIDGEPIGTVSDNFITDVRNHLMVNAKKYSELYRTYVITDEQLSLTDNYYLEEKMDRDTTDNSSDKYGARTDSSSESLGARTDSNSSTLGQQLNHNEFSVGQQLNHNEITIGEQENVEDVDNGVRHNKTELTAGAHTDTDSRDVSPYDMTAGNYTSDSKDTHMFAQRVDTTIEDINASKDKTTTTLGERTDISDETLGTRKDITDDTIGSRTDTSSSTIGAQSNSTSNIKGEENDTHSKTGTEDYTLTRKGNIGTMAPIDMLVKSNDFWSIYEFYEMIFRDICKELLLV